MKKLLITGGCGFIGTSLIKRLVEKQEHCQIIVLDNFSEGTPEDLGEVCEYTIADNTIHEDQVVLVEADICNSELTDKLTKGVDTIIHLAANTGVAPSVEDPRMDMVNNVIGTFNLLESSRLNKVEKVIFASSGAPAGLVNPPIHEELPAHPISPYGASKLAGEGYCSAYSKSYGISTVCLRFGNVYGPRSKRKSSVVAKFIRQAVEGETCVIYGDGRQTRDFIYIEDLVDAIVLSMEKDLKCEIFQIASGEELTVGEVATMLSSLLSVKGVNMDTQFDSPRIGDVARNFADISKAARLLGWQPKMEIQKGLEKTIDYFLDVK